MIKKLKCVVTTTYNKNDVIILLKDIKGKEKILSKKGVQHYSEVLELEKAPTENEIDIYEKALEKFSYKTAEATATLGKILYNKYGENLKLVSLARAGIPIGILLKKYIEFKYGKNIPHYAISLIRGKGIDKNAISYIVDKHGTYGIQFIDGWIGKGATNKVLKEECEILKKIDDKYKKIDDSLNVLIDPIGISENTGSIEDFLIPSACLNATISGCISRSFYKTNSDFHGAMYFDYLVKKDISNEFIKKIISNFKNVSSVNKVNKRVKVNIEDEIEEILEQFNVSDRELIKPGLCETTRVLLRNIPCKILVKDLKNINIQNIVKLCNKKNIEILQYPLKIYQTCGIIDSILYG